IAGMLGFSATTAEAIRTLDEHWDGRGQPYNLQGDAIPLFGRIVCLTQTFEVFMTTYGLGTAFEMARARRGRWFDPSLVDALWSLRNESDFWQSFDDRPLVPRIAALEPVDEIRMAD